MKHSICVNNFFLYGKTHALHLTSKKYKNSHFWRSISARCVGGPETPAAPRVERWKTSPGLPFRSRPTWQSGQPCRLLQRQGAWQAGRGHNRNPAALGKHTHIHHDQPENHSVLPRGRGSRQGRWSHMVQHCRPRCPKLMAGHVEKGQGSANKWPCEHRCLHFLSFCCLELFPRLSFCDEGKAST